MSTCLVITGAAGELGKKVLEAALADPSIDRVIATSRARSIVGQSKKLVTLPGLDLSGPSHGDLAAAVDQFDATDVGLLHCAGAFPAPAPLHRTSLTEVTSAFSANTLSFLGAATAVLPYMRRRRVGRVVAFTSHTQGAAYPFMGSFNLSKAALLSAVRTLANENARHGVAVNALAIATLQTQTEREIKPAGAYEDWVSVEGLAEYAIYLATKEQTRLNGNQLHYWGYSRSFFEQSIFDRNSLDLDVLDSPDAG